MNDTKYLQIGEKFENCLVTDVIRSAITGELVPFPGATIYECYDLDGGCAIKTDTGFWRDGKTWQKLPDLDWVGFSYLDDAYNAGLTADGQIYLCIDDEWVLRADNPHFKDFAEFSHEGVISYAKTDIGYDLVVESSAYYEAIQVDSLPNRCRTVSNIYILEYDDFVRVFQNDKLVAEFKGASARDVGFSAGSSSPIRVWVN